ncbi:amino acid ABC transporter substrate-binding protein, PAAT family [Rhizobiales bacterium GAS191]|nr:amino acid ABC transporter substrate-binding protein, PAAT family [Rhizobiales bacterium GAS191]
MTSKTLAHTTFACLALTGILLAAQPLRAGQLPDAVKQAGVLHLSVNATYPPIEYKDTQTGKLVGLDIDLGEALAKSLGLRIEWTEVAFAQLMPSLQTGRTDFILSGLSDLPARHDAMDFIDYLKSGAQFYTLAKNSFSVPEDLCGKRVGTIRSTSFPDQIRKWSAEHCEAQGKPAIEVVGGENTPDVRTQLKQDRIDAAVQGSENIPFMMSQEEGVFKPVGLAFTVLYQGIAFRKSDTEFREAVTDALQALIKDGTYQKTLDTWHLSNNAVSGILINGEARR